MSPSTFANCTLRRSTAAAGTGSPAGQGSFTGAAGRTIGRAGLARQEVSSGQKSRQPLLAWQQAELNRLNDFLRPAELLQLQCVDRGRCSAEGGAQGGISKEGLRAVLVGCAPAGLSCPSHHAEGVLLDPCNPQHLNYQTPQLQSTSCLSAVVLLVFGAAVVVAMGHL